MLNEYEVSDDSVKKYRIFNRIRLFATVTLIVLVLLFFAGTVASGIKYIKSTYNKALNMKQQALEMKDELKIALSCIKDQNVEGAKASIDKVDEINEGLREDLKDPVWKYAKMVPVYGKDIDSIEKLLNIIEEISDDIVKPVINITEEYPLSEIKVGDGYDLEIVNAYFDLLEDMEPKLNDISTKLEGFTLSIDTGNTIGEYVEKLGAAAESYAEVKDYLSLLRIILDDDVNANFLVVAQNSAEMRASGGFPGSIGVMRIEDGIMTIQDFESVYKVLPYGTPAKAEITDEENELFANWMRYPRDACYNPDFERVAEIWAMSYETSKDEEIDGVISLTPAVIQELMKYTGGATLSDGTWLDGENATTVLQYDLYKKYLSSSYTLSNGNEIADDLFAETAKVTMGMLATDINIDRCKGYFSVFKEGLEDRTIMIWMEDDEKQDIVRESKASGALTAPGTESVAGVYFSCSDPSKMGWYLNIDTEVGDATKNSDGSNSYEVTVTLTNVIEDEDIRTSGTYILGSYNGGIRGYIHLFAPLNGTIDNFETSNNTRIYEYEYEGLQLGFTHSIVVYKDNPIVIKYKVTTAVGVEDELTISSTPTLQKYR